MVEGIERWKGKKRKELDENTATDRANMKALKNWYD